jgi:hypothetical protein
VVTRLPVDQAVLLAPGFEAEAAPEGFGKSRVYFNAPADIEKLRALVLVAYEEELKRHAPGAPEVDDEDTGGAAAPA